MKKLLILCFLVTVVFSCSSFKEWAKDVREPESIYDDVHENHLPLSEQRLIPRPGNDGHLTNQICLKFYGGECEERSLKTYDLRDIKIREKLNEFRFACKVGGKRYRICKDEPGLCRSEQICLKWGTKLISRDKVCREWGVKKSFLHAISQYDFMLDGATECKQGM